MAGKRPLWILAGLALLALLGGVAVWAGSAAGGECWFYSGDGPTGRLYGGAARLR